MAKKQKMTSKQKAFCKAYLKNGGNATTAAIEAGYSKKTASRIGTANLKKAMIAEYINKRLEPVEKRQQIGAEDALNALIDIWRGNTQTGISRQRDNLQHGKVLRDVEYDYTPDLENKIKALDLYLKYKSLLSQVQLKKAQKEIELMQAKLETLKNLNDSTTEEKLDSLLDKIEEGLDDA